MTDYKASSFGFNPVDPDSGSSTLERLRKAAEKLKPEANYCPNCGIKLTERRKV